MMVKDWLNDIKFMLACLLHIYFKVYVTDKFDFVLPWVPKF